MISFHVDARDGAGSASNGCAVCCCAPAAVRPGETNKVVLNYASWVAPIGGKGLICGTVFVSELIQTCPATNAGNQPPTNTNKNYATTLNVNLVGSVSPGSSDPEVDALVYSHVPLFGPFNGTLAMNTDGSFTYTPRLGFTGRDEFVFETSDQINTPVRRIGYIAVNPVAGPNLPAMPLNRPELYVPPASVHITNNGQAMEFAIEASPALRVGDIYRMTIRQPAMDCDGTKFFNVFCIDWTVGKC